MAVSGYIAGIEPASDPSGAAFGEGMDGAFDLCLPTPTGIAVARRCGLNIRGYLQHSQEMVPEVPIRL